MPVQRSRFHTAIQNPPQQQSVVAIIEPTQGLNVAQPITDLRPGETPASQNFVFEEGYITPRSGISVWQSNVAAADAQPVLGAIAAQLNTGEDAAVVMWQAGDISANSISGAVFQSWTTIPQEIDTSSRTGKYWSMARFFESDATGSVIPRIIACNEDSYPVKIGFDGSSSQTLSTATTTNDFFKYVAAFDDRCILFNSADSFADKTAANYNPTRVQWSARGAPTDFANGGFEVLTDMHGVGTGAVAERDRLVLLSSENVSIGRPRRDAYAFDFFKLDTGKGCPEDYDRTPQPTPAGTIWLGDGFQFYRLIGNEVRPLGDKVRNLLRTEMREWNQCWSFYNPKNSVYGFMYSDTTGYYPTKALFLRVDSIRPIDNSRDEGIWFKQDFEDIFSLASNVVVPGFTAGTVVGGSVMLSGDTLDLYRLLSDQTNDDGTAIDCRWRSHAISNDREHTNQLAFVEAWLDVEESTSTATTGFHYTTDRADSFTDAGDFVTSNETPFTSLALTTPAARQPQFELRIDDGSQPKIGRIQLTLRSYTGKHRG